MDSQKSCQRLEAWSTCWVNLHVSLYMFTPSKYWVAHPRCLAACSISDDSSLGERFCCWSCHLPNKKSEGEGHYKSLWPTLDDFIWHWYNACDAHFDWDSIAIHLGLTCEDLAFTLLSIDLGATPLPTKPEAIAVLPDLLPPRPQGHNALIFAKPWYRLQEGGFRYVAKPPSYPPPHVKDSQHVGPIRPLPSSSSGSVLPSSAASALRNLPSLNAPTVTTTAKSGATSKSSNRPKDPVTVKAPPKAAPFLSLAASPNQLWFVVMVLGLCSMLLRSRALPEWVGWIRCLHLASSFLLNLCTTPSRMQT